MDIIIIIIIIISLIIQSTYTLDIKDMKNSIYDLHMLKSFTSCILFLCTHPSICLINLSTFFLSQTSL
jgi:hypothetical protein